MQNHNKTILTTYQSADFISDPSFSQYLSRGMGAAHKMRAIHSPTALNTVYIVGKLNDMIHCLP